MFKAMQMSRQSLWVMSLSIMTLMSCTNDDFESSAISCGREISFGVSTQSVGSRSNAPAEATDTFRLVADDPQAQTLLCTAETAPMSDAVSRATSVTSADRITKIGVIAHASWYAPLLMANDLYKRNADGVYQSTDVRYWIDDASATVDFYAFAPYSPSGMTFPTSKGDRQVEYTVPTESENQQDVMLAVSKGIKGNHNKAVGLPFKHLLAGVRVNFLSIPDNWTIESVELEGVYSNGSLDFTADSPTWAPSGATTTVTSTNGDKTETLFMLLPQTGGATLKIVVNDGTTDKTYTKNLGSSNWSMGNITTYSINIKPDYTLEFVTEPTDKDAHYVIYPITIKADKVPGGSWTLSSGDENVTLVEKNKLATDIQALIDNGYWLDSYTNGGNIKGSSTLSSSTTGDVQIYVFLAENVSDYDRAVTLSLKPTQSSYTSEEYKFKQYCPAWNNGVGVEQLQDMDYPWGFCWDENMKVVYKMPGGWGNAFLHVLFLFFGNHDYIEDNGSAISGNWTVTVDFSKVPKLNKAISADDGKTNTWEIYNFNGVSEAQAIMDQLQSWGGQADRELPTNPNEFAARACAMKNKFQVSTTTSNGQTAYKPVLAETDMVWYLPAQDQAQSLNAPNLINTLSGNYWTSTAITTGNGDQAYKYTAGGSTSPENRNNPIHVRAIRNRP